MKSLLLTGATGFIGRHCLPLLAALGYEIHAVSSRPRSESALDVHWHQLDLLDWRQIANLLSDVRPTHLLHLAWYVAPGKLATSNDNYLWVQASLELFRQFHEHGGQRAVIAGSGYEYDWHYGYCSEALTPKVPNTFYGACKHALHSLVEAYSNQTELRSAWARIFFLYGPHEHPDRLVSSVIRSLLRGEPALCSHGRQIRDYLYVQDVADALITLLESDVVETVNIGSGNPITLKDLICQTASKLNRRDLVRLGAVPSHPFDSRLVVADTTRLSTELGWQPKYDLDRGLDETIAWWRDNLAA